jgi:hypothetical protein
MKLENWEDDERDFSLEDDRVVGMNSGDGKRGSSMVDGGNVGCNLETVRDSALSFFNLCCF